MIKFRTERPKSQQLKPKNWKIAPPKTDNQKDQEKGSQNQKLFKFEGFNIIIIYLNKSNEMQTQTPESFFNRTLTNFDQLFLVNKKLSALFDADIQNFSQNNAVEETFIYECLSYIGDDNAQQEANRFEAITLIYPALVQKFQKFPPEIQDSVRSGLLNVVLARQKNIKALSSLGMLIRQIIEIDSQVKDGFQQWVDPLTQVIKWMGSEQQFSAQAGVQFFIFLLKQTTFTSTNSELPFYKLSNSLLQTLFQIFTSAPQQQQQTKISAREKILFLALQVIKCFSFFDGSKDIIVNECFNDTVQLWASLLVSILKSSVNSHLGIKKYAIKILVVMYRDMSSLCQRRLKNVNAQAQLLGAWEFIYRFIPCYLAVQSWSLNSYQKQKISNVNAIPYFDEDYDISFSPVEAIAHNILQLLLVFSSSNFLNFTVRLSIYHIINALFHYYIVSNYELQTWNCNNLYFVTSLEHESIRGKILNIINDIIEKNGDYAIQAILLIAEKFLINQKQAQTVETIAKIVQSMNIKEVLESGRVQLSLKVEDILKFTNISGVDIKQTLHVSGESWKKTQVALSILGRFAEDIIVFQSKQQGAFDIQSFVKGLIKQFDIEELDISVCLLKGQTLYCLTRFTEIISIRYKHLFSDLVASCSSCVGEIYPTAIRVATLKSLTIFFRKIQKHKLKLTPEQVKKLQYNRVVEGIMTLQITTQINNYQLETLIQIVKCLGTDILPEEITPLYLLDNIHKNISHPNTLKICFNFLEIACSNTQSFEKIILALDQNSECSVIPHFIKDCLETYLNIVKSEQKKYLKSLDIDLIASVLKLTDIIIAKCPKQFIKAQEQLVDMTLSLADIIQYNDNLQIQVACTICLKNLIRLCPQLIKERKYEKNIIDAIHTLLKIPADKTFESASIYVGNLILLAFEYLIEKPDQEILQQVVLKVFKSRTPSVIQSLVLVYSRMINGKTDPAGPFAKGQWQNKLKNITDFLASFSIQNRMGLKILVDKWLLQQSLFRGNFTKISTFMALSKMFLLRDKRIDNLLVIGFNPSHTNICHDVNAPLKILATLIRCLHNQMGGKSEDNDDQQQQGNFQLKQQSQNVSIDVGLEKFKDMEDASKNQQVGSLADRENQQGSTCYMSAMLQFYDDGQQCDQTTEQDLIALKDSSTKFKLAEYLTDFFLYLNNSDSIHYQYFMQCLKQLLKEDVKLLQKYVKVAV